MTKLQTEVSPISAAAHQRVAQSTAALVVKGTVSGVLMGLANLVPGVSAGAVLLATGIFRAFIDGIAELSSFRFRLPTLVLLGSLGAAWVLAVLLGAGPVKQLVVDHRWIMYSLFVGLTLGGVPLVWRGKGERGAPYWLGAAVGFIVMAGLAVLQFTGALESSRRSDSMMMLLLGGVLGAGATVLPGGSGTFVLLLMGLYVPILSAVSRFKDAAVAADVESALREAWILGPFAVGMGLGLVSISLLMKWTLKHFPTSTFGVLLGLLVGSVVGLWPFQEGKRPVAGDFVKGRIVSEEDLAAIRPDDWPVVFFSPTAPQVVSAVVLIAVACALTVLLTRLEDRLGGAEQSKELTTR